MRNFIRSLPVCALIVDDRAVIVDANQRAITEFSGQDNTLPTYFTGLVNRCSEHEAHLLIRRALRETKATTSKLDLLREKAAIWTYIANASIIPGQQRHVLLTLKRVSQTTAKIHCDYGIISFSPSEDYTCNFVSSCVTKRLGVSREQLLGKNIRQIIRSPAISRQVVQTSTGKCEGAVVFNIWKPVIIYWKHDEDGLHIYLQRDEEAEVSAKREFYSILFDGLVDGAWTSIDHPDVCFMLNSGVDNPLFCSIITISTLLL